MRCIDLTGNKYGKLTVIKRNGNHPKNGRVAWLCKCECGNMAIVGGTDLKTGNTKSCGCMSSRHKIKDLNKTHGMRSSRIYNIWSLMKARCYKSYNASYKNYGAKGITVCDKWHKFEGFYEDMKDGYSDSLTIERIDNSKGYCKENCTWIPRSQQNLNKSNIISITFQGETLPLKTMCTKLGIPYKTIYYRITHGWSVEDALTKPIKTKNRK